MQGKKTTVFFIISELINNEKDVVLLSNCFYIFKYKQRNVMSLGSKVKLSPQRMQYSQTILYVLEGADNKLTVSLFLEPYQD